MSWQHAVLCYDERRIRDVLETYGRRVGDEWETYGRRMGVVCLPY